MASSRWMSDEVKTHRVSSEAYRRKYGCADEIVRLGGSDKIAPRLAETLKSSGLAAFEFDWEEHESEAV